MSATPEPIPVLQEQLQDAAASFAVGVPAAVAEFLREPAEPFEIGGDGLSISTPRGGIRITPVEGLRPLAYEAPSQRPGRWLHGIVFCLPEAAARMGGRRCLTELGSDTQALQAEERDAELFDLGVGAPHIDFCVRTGDRELAERLHAHCGRAVTEAELPDDLFAALIGANPDRVVRSRLGRIEVTSPIPHDLTPLGPHTHLFPGKLGAGAHHDPAVAPPAGWRIGLQLYPPHPQFDLAGESIPFDMARHEAFQALLQAWGDKDYLAAKAAANLCAEAALRAVRAEDGEGPAWEVARRQWTAMRGAPERPPRLTAE